MDFKNANELLDLCKKHDLPISEVMRQREIVEGKKKLIRFIMQWQEFLRS